jgi:preprotein translocase subunit YajC
MILHSMDAMLALGPSPSQPGTAPDPRAQMLQMVGMLVIMGFIFYFALIRPQRLRARQQENLLKNLKAGDKILTASGIVGIVVSVKDKTVSIRSADTKLEILKSAVSEITERSGAAGES